MKIKFTQLESDAFWTDIDWVRMKPAERGTFCSILLHLYSHKGKCEYDIDTLTAICNCENAEEFEKYWEKVSKKFQTRNGLIKHKRVTKEINRAKKLQQAKRKAGLRGAQVTWQNHGTPNGTAIAKERKENESEKKINNRNEKEVTPASDTASNSSLDSTSTPFLLTQENKDIQEPIGGKSLQTIANEFFDTLERYIPPRTRSDRTCFNNITFWLIDGCRKKKFNTYIFDRVLDLAKEARKGQKPAAVFMSLLKKELRYNTNET
jgi:uncharacterized protein YdaU (DUF1376 family)